MHKRSNPQDSDPKALLSLNAAGLFELSICGVGELHEFSSLGVTHVVSIWEGAFAGNPEPRKRIKELFPKARPHFVVFDDVFCQVSKEYPPDRASIGNVLWFTSNLKPEDYLLIHCAAGISRSTAIAFAALCHHAGPGNETACFQAVREIRPCAYPNSLIVRIADDILGRKGAMIEANEEGCRPAAEDATETPG